VLIFPTKNQPKSKGFTGSEALTYTPIGKWFWVVLFSEHHPKDSGGSGVLTLLNLFSFKGNLSCEVTNFAQLGYKLRTTGLLYYLLYEVTNFAQLGI